MDFLGAIICLLGGGMSYSVDKRLYSPTVMFGLFWATLLFLAGLNLYGIYPSSTYAVFLITVGTLSFILGGGLNKRKRYKIKYNYIINKRVYNIAVLICLCSLYLNISFIFNFITSGFDVHYIYSLMASMVGGEETDLSDLYDPKLVLIQQFIGYPLLYTLVPISIVEYISTKEKNYLIIAILLSLIRFLFDFRRTYIVIIVVFIIFVLILRKKETIQKKLKNSHLTFRKKLVIISSFLVLIGCFSMLSKVRRGDEGSDEYSLGSNFYYYYVGSIPYFSLRVDALQDIDYTYGFTSFRGIISPFYGILNLIGFEKSDLVEIANENVNSLHNTVLLISKDHQFNSYATSFFEFYLDGGIFGVILLSALFGFYAQSIYNDMRTYKNDRYVMKYALFVSIFLYMSVLHFNGVVVCYIWPFFLERFFYNRINL